MIDITYEQLFTMKSLYKAHLRGRRCKRSKRQLVKFELVTLEHLAKLYKQLMNGKYKPAKYSTFIVEVPKRREIQTQPYENRVVQHVLCDDMLTPYFSRRMIIDNAACQKGKGMHFALDRFQAKLQKYAMKYGQSGYFLKCDILKYFPSIPHSKLKEMCCNEISDLRIRGLIEDIIDSYHTKPSFLHKYGIEPLGKGDNTCRGIPIGNQTSQIFGTYYLNPVDRLVKEKLRIKIYSRYMDDFVLLHHDRNYLVQVLSELRQLTDKLGLSLNSKTQIFPVKNGVTYLGYVFKILPSKRVVRCVKKDVKRRFRSRAKLLKKAYLEGIIPRERVVNSLAAFHGHLGHGNNAKFEMELNKKLTFKEDIEYAKQS